MLKYKVIGEELLANKKAGSGIFPTQPFYDFPSVDMYISTKNKYNRLHIKYFLVIYQIKFASLMLQ